MDQATARAGRPEFLDDKLYTAEEYLDREAASDAKHDYLDGRILDMAGGSLRHNTIAANLVGELGNACKGTPCRVVGSDQRLRDAGGALYTYPDVQVICGEPRFAPDDKSQTTIVNPQVICEVLSPSTENYDRGDRFFRYILMPSLREYILVSQERRRVETFHRRDDGTWLIDPIEGLGATLHIRSLDVRIALSEIFRDVAFDAPTTREPAARHAPV